VSSSGIYLNEDEIANISDIGKFIDSSASKKQVVDAVLAVNAATKYFVDYNIDVDTTSLCNVDGFVQTHGIVDIYLNGFYVNVIKVDSSEELLVPCLHFEKKIAPIAYMFLLEQSDEQLYDVLGFVLKDDVDTNNLQDGYYAVEKDVLKDFSEIEYLFAGHVEDEIPDDFEKQTFDYFDGINRNTEDFIYVLLNSQMARSFFIKAYKAKNIFNHVAMPMNISVKSSADVVIAEEEPLIQSDHSDESEITLNVENPSIDNFDVSDISVSEVQVDDSDIIDLDAFSGIVDGDKTSQDDVSDENYYAEEIVLNEESLEYKTGTTPSLESIENEISMGEQVKPDETSYSNDDTIDNLYANEENNVYGAQFVKQEKKSSFIPAILILALFAGCGYLGYTKFYKQNSVTSYTEETPYEEPALNQDAPAEQQTDAMPNETVENKQFINKSEEAVAVSIPAIEKNLDASILVENLSVSWQVPSGYVSNSSAKRYFTKIGKIIQLNLKTEMLLLNKPPISDKIELELEFNKSLQNFEIKGFKYASGEQTIDDLVKLVVQKTIKEAKYTDMSIFNNIPDNPVLIIHL